MESWEFLIQREGDRGWRPIKTGNLQLREGKYRIVANSNLLDTQIQTRVTHQTLDSTTPQRRSQSCNQKTNASGVLTIVPVTHLHSGIWQFVCSGTTSAQTAWHQILKLRVLPRTQSPSPINSTHPRQVEILDTNPDTSPPILPHNQQPQTYILPASLHQFASVDQSEDLPTPTAPLVSISMLGEQENWADGLERLLEQLERESLQTPPQQPAVRETFTGTIQLYPIVDSPLQLISLDRSTFSGIIPGNRLTISGACNLQLLKANLIKTVKIEKLSICLRHPQTSEIIVSIEQSLPPNLDTFAFRGQLELPIEPKITLLLGEVNLYDRHHIQLGSSGFTVTLNLNPLHESERSLFQFFDRSKDGIEADLAQITQELQLEAATIGTRRSSSRAVAATTPSTIKPPNSPQYPTVPLAYQRESLFTHPDITAVEPAVTSHRASQEVVGTKNRVQTPAVDITGDLEIDFAHTTVDAPGDTRNQANWEIVIDD